MTSSTSVFSKVAQDESEGAGRGRIVDPRREAGVILYRSDFDRGFDGWIDHWDGYHPVPMVSRTSEMQLRGSHSLMLSTGEHADPIAADLSNAAFVFKRLVRYRPESTYRYMSFSGFLALGIGGFSGSWDGFVVMIDTQSMDNSVRSFFKLYCKRRELPVYSSWSIRGDGGETDYKDLPGSTHIWQGDNDSKHNFGYFRLTVDLAANAGKGGYVEAQINQKTFDLRGLGAGSAIEPPQSSGTNHITEFNGGFNVGLGLIRNNAIVGGCQLFADDLVISAASTLEGLS